MGDDVQDPPAVTGTGGLTLHKPGAGTPAPDGGGKDGGDGE